jgi:hypothetical protein
MEIVYFCFVSASESNPNTLRTRDFQDMYEVKLYFQKQYEQRSLTVLFAEDQVIIIRKTEEDLQKSLSTNRTLVNTLM